MAAGATERTAVPVAVGRVSLICTAGSSPGSPGIRPLPEAGARLAVERAPVSSP